MLATDGFEQAELTDPKKNLEKAGATVTVLSVEKTPKEIKRWDQTDWGRKVKIDGLVSQANPSESMLWYCRGQINSGKLRMDNGCGGFVKRFAEMGKTVGAICHVPWILVEADVVRGKTMTSWPSVHTDLNNAGANWMHEKIVQDGQVHHEQEAG